MNLDVYRRRIISHVTNLPELLYAVTRHWYVPVFVVGAATLVALCVVVTQPVIYEGNAALLFDYENPNIVEQNERPGMARSPGRRAEQAMRLYDSRVAMLTGPSVLRRVVLDLKATTILSQNRDSDNRDANPFRAFMKSLRKRVKGALSFLKTPSIHDYSEEHLIEKAVESFADRSSIVPDPKTSTVTLRLQGRNREILKEELGAWITAYRNRVVELGKENLDIFIASRERHWQELERAAKAAVDIYKSQNSEVTRAAHELIFEEIKQLQVLLTELQRPLPEPALQLSPSLLPSPRAATTGRGPSRVLDPDLTRLSEQRRDLENELAAALRTLPEESDTVRGIRRNLDAVNKEIRSVERGIPTDDPVARMEELLEEDREARRQELLAAEAMRIEHERSARSRLEAERTTRASEIRKSIATKISSYNKLGRQLEELETLEEEYAQAKQTRKRYELMALEEADRLASRQSVEVRVRDRPRVSLTPYESKVKKNAVLGVAGAIIMGLLLTIGIEVLRNKIRFRSDLKEFGVPVVGIIPRK